ncbi:MAG: nitronate monooxygenase [Acidobacteriota bacterium]|nr:nitronate monooxygenase [Acidobacteriota bacterium]
MLTTILTTEWGLRYPVIGAPMANIGHGRLARAITAAGGLGMIGVGVKESVDFIETESAIARGDGVPAKFGIGLLAWAIEARPELFEAAVQQRPFLISISFSSVRPYADRLHRAGILLATQVNTRAAALEAESAGTDLIVSQGTEAGGHTGAVGTLPLLQMVLDSIGTPVVAAGGIASPRGVAAALAAGAAGVWVGTAFLLSPESLTTDDAHRRIAAASETDTIHTPVFDRANRLPWPSQFPGRALRNSFTEEWHGREEELVANTAEMARFRAGAVARDYDITSIFAGQAVGMLRHQRPAGEVVRHLGEGAEELLRSRTRDLLGAGS